MQAVDIIRRKRDGGELTPAEVGAFVAGTSPGGWPEYQLSALLMAIYFKGMTAAETATLTAAMTDSGRRIDLSDITGVKVDKHSTGGVGDKTSLILGPLAAACGVVVPMMSGRGLGHTGGTLDKLESIPGFRVNLSLDEFRAALRAVGIGMIGQTTDVAPADKVLYALRDVTATVESVPLITASILSKKLAEGISGLVLDVKCGRGAFMKTLPAARELAQSLVTVGTANGLRVEAVITAMDAPLGRAVGNALEVAECVAILANDPSRAADDLSELSVLLAARMVRLAGVEPTLEAATIRVRRALADGSALEVLQRMVEQQGGDPRVADDPLGVLPAAPSQMTVTAPRAGYVTAIDAENVGYAAMMLGAGRRRAEDGVDAAVGVWVDAPVGTRVAAGDRLFTVHQRHAATAAVELLSKAVTIGDVPPAKTPLVLEVIA